ncbi:MAG TPA: amidohydrolase [Alloiococcus sp.]|nr:amidohydrolase [Alloiococcus sp.]
MNQITDDLFEDMVKWRRHLHKHPELSNHETNTIQYIIEQLESFNGDFELIHPTSTSVIAKLKGTKPGKTVVLRSDVDALPIEEQTDLSFKSINDGVMHACGHDGHTAMLLAAAKVLVDKQDELTGEVWFLFQHAEELASGALEILKTGQLSNIDYIFGVHLNNNFPVGQYALAPGRMMSASDGFWIDIKGKGGHAAMPQTTTDAIYVGTQLINAFNQVVARQIDANDQAIISVTTFNSGFANNVIPDNAHLSGCTRSFSETTREYLHEKMKAIADNYALATDCQIEIKWQRGADAVINTPELTEEISSLIKNEIEDSEVIEIVPRMISEDFGSYLKEFPGNFLFVGSGNHNKGIDKALHHPEFTFDEEAMKYGAALHIQTALKMTKHQEALI